MKKLDRAVRFVCAVILATPVLAAPPSPTGLAPRPILTAYEENYQPESALLGMAVGGGGDFNGDGYSDVVAGAPGSMLGASQRGAVVVFHGSAAGPHTQADWLRYGADALDGYGTGVASAGDVNGDGYDDLIFSASFTSHPIQVLVYLGSASGLASTPHRTYSFTSTETTWPVPATSAGDVNGDGYDDVIIGHRRYASAFARQGKAVVYHGSSTGLPATPAFTVTGTAAEDNLGFSVASAGDVNGDGYSDVLIGTRTQALLYRGSATGVKPTSWSAPLQPVIGAYYSYGEVSSAGDVNGDGYDDVVVGSPSCPLDVCAALYYGSPQGLSPTPAWTIGGPPAVGFMGCSVGAAGDVNADGYGDIVVGACDFPGRAYLFLGSSAGPASTPAWSFTGQHETAQLGRAVRGAGDVNGDGRDDVIVGGPGIDGFNAGRAYLFLGVLDESTDLRMSRGSDPSLSLTWESSCNAQGMDWEVYAGTLGSFASHTPVLCSTNGEPAAGIVPLGGDEYYLVVPRSVNLEGSYGTSSVGMDRPQGGQACLAQVIASCP